MSQEESPSSEHDRDDAQMIDEDAAPQADNALADGSAQPFGGKAVHVYVPACVNVILQYAETSKVLGRPVRELVRGVASGQYALHGTAACGVHVNTVLRELSSYGFETVSHKVYYKAASHGGLVFCGVEPLNKQVYVADEDLYAPGDNDGGGGGGNDTGAHLAKTLELHLKPYRMNLFFHFMDLNHVENKACAQKDSSKIKVAGAGSGVGIGGIPIVLPGANGSVPNMLAAGGGSIGGVFSAASNGSGIIGGLGNGIGGGNALGSVVGAGAPNFGALSAAGSAGGVADAKPSKDKEKTIQEVIEKVLLWRRLYKGMQNDRGETMKMSLQEAADHIKVPKKTLDDYLQQIRKAKKLGFDFNKDFNKKIGHLRKFIKVERQKQQNSKKNSVALSSQSGAGNGSGNGNQASTLAPTFTAAKAPAAFQATFYTGGAQQYNNSEDSKN